MDTKLQRRGGTVGGLVDLNGAQNQEDNPVLAKMPSSVTGIKNRPKAQGPGLTIWKWKTTTKKLLWAKAPLALKRSQTTPVKAWFLPFTAPSLILKKIKGFWSQILTECTGKGKGLLSPAWSCPNLPPQWLCPAAGGQSPPELLCSCGSPEACSYVDKACRSVRGCIHWGLLPPTSPLPCVPQPKREALLLSPCFSRNLPWVVSGVTCNQSSCLACRALHGPWTPGTPDPDQTAERPGVADRRTMGLLGWKHSSLPRSVGRAVWWGGKVINADGLCFPKPAFLINSCVYTKLEERERKDNVLRMTSFCLVGFDSHHCRQEWWGRWKLHGASGCAWCDACRVFLHACVY